LYLIISAAALGVLVVALFFLASPIAAAIVFITGIAGLVLRWTAMPMFAVVVVAWIAFAPNFLPYEAINFSNLTNIPGSWFRIQDIIVIGAMLIYLVAQYRLSTIAQQGMPFEAKPAFLKRSAKPTVRAVAAITDSELIRFFMRIGVFLIGGQMLWLFVNHVGLDFRRVPPFVLLEIDARRFSSFSSYQVPGVPLVVHRILISMLLIFSFAFFAKILFHIWRLRRLNRDEGMLILQDTQWSEQRRELNRQEKWRAWARAKALGKRIYNTSPGCAFYIVTFLVLAILLMCGGFISYQMSR
jgi:hypothetical protein